jgi:thiol-disulfide isomerase/thioredoxin
LGGATEWLNSPALGAEQLRGKVVLVQFGTYTCINWLRTLPYVRAWAEKYGNQGLVVVGVHSPELPFEHDLDNVRWAAKDMRVAYPIAIDNDFAIWNALGNQYWPALYLVDVQGRIRPHQFGEGGYEALERAVQQLLLEAGSRGAAAISSRSTGAVSRRRPTGTTSSRPRTTWDTSVPRTSRPPGALCATSRASMPCLSASRSTNGRCPAIGR